MKKLIIFIILCTEIFAQIPYRSARFPGKTVKVGGGGGSPAFVGEVACSITSGQVAANYTVDSTSPTVITLAAGIASGHRIGIAISLSLGSTATISDSKGNSYDVSVQSTDTFLTGYCFSAPITSPLVSGDTISVTWGTASYVGINWVVMDLSGCASSGQPDQSATNQAYGSTVNLAANTTAANTVLFGLLFVDDNTATYSGGNWTNVGSYRDNIQNNRRMIVVQTTKSSAGSQNPGGAWAAGSGPGQVNAWVALK